MTGPLYNLDFMAQELEQIEEDELYEQWLEVFGPGKERSARESARAEMQEFKDDKELYKQQEHVNQMLERSRRVQAQMKSRGKSRAELDSLADALNNMTL
jgi:hypothetical protein